ncbi:hypothetical protein BC629DRAFT_1526254 [Irpex lacteus]|nr:hypothetical protein BC629DRAFT_1526254 [Irpex lacteus]
MSPSSPRSPQTSINLDLSTPVAPMTTTTIDIDSETPTAPIVKSTDPPIAPPSSLDRIQVSLTFHPDNTLDTTPPDTFIFSSDGIFFSVHSHRILSASTNNFADLLCIRSTV